MTIPERVQQYLIDSRRQTHRATEVGPFTALLHPTDTDVESNVAIPHSPPTEAAEQNLDEALRATFTSDGRIPAIQWITEYAPSLASTLLALGYSEQQRETLLVRVPGSGPRALIPVAGLTFSAITNTSPLEDVRENMDVNEFGFAPDTAQPTSQEQATRFRATLGAATAVTARLNGRPASAGMYTAPLAGVTELTGIATLEQYRGQGIAAALTAHLAGLAFAQGCDLVFLRTANPAAWRSYEKAGFRPLGAVLIYVAGIPSRDS